MSSGRSRSFTLAAVVAAVLGLTPPAQAAPSGSALRIPVSDLVSIRNPSAPDFREFAVTGTVNLTVPRCTPGDPCRSSATLLSMSAVDQATGTSCTVTGTATFPARTGTFTGVYSPIDPCRELLAGGLAIRYVITTTETGQLTATADALGAPVT